MRYYYVPYNRNQPAALNINGHRLLILSRDRELLEGGLTMIGADRVKRVRAGQGELDEAKVVEKLAKSVQGGVVVAAGDLEVDDLIRSLETQLPWLQ